MILDSKCRLTREEKLPINVGMESFVSSERKRSAGSLYYPALLFRHKDGAQRYNDESIPWPLFFTQLFLFWNISEFLLYTRNILSILSLANSSTSISIETAVSCSNYKPTSICKVFNTEGFSHCKIVLNFERLPPVIHTRELVKKRKRKCSSRRNEERTLEN